MLPSRGKGGDRCRLESLIGYSVGWGWGVPLTDAHVTPSLVFTKRSPLAVANSTESKPAAAGGVSEPLPSHPHAAVEKGAYERTSYGWGGGMGASLQDPGSMALTHPRARTPSLLSVRPASDRDQCPASESAHISRPTGHLGSRHPSHAGEVW